MKPLFEIYRPQTWDELVGQAHVKKAVGRMHKRGDLGGRAFWISGPSGVGKTTIAYLIAGDVCDPDNFIELDAGEISPSKLADLERSLRYRAIGGLPGRAVLVNEAHGLKSDAIRKLLVMLERVPVWATWVFTTTNAGQKKLLDGIDANPLLSRCIEFKLDGGPLVEEFARRAMEVAEQEDLGGAEFVDYLALANRCECNLRRMLCAIEAGEMCRDMSEADRILALLG